MGTINLPFYHILQEKHPEGLPFTHLHVKPEDAWKEAVETLRKNSERDPYFKDAALVLEVALAEKGEILLHLNTPVGTFQLACHNIGGSRGEQKDVPKTPVSLQQRKPQKS